MRESRHRSSGPDLGGAGPHCGACPGRPFPRPPLGPGGRHYQVLAWCTACDPQGGGAAPGPVASGDPRRTRPAPTTHLLLADVTTY